MLVVSRPEDAGAIVTLHRTGVTGRFEGLVHRGPVASLRLDGAWWEVGVDQLVVLDSFTTERIWADGDRRYELVAGDWLLKQGDVFRMLKNGEK